ncbi:hypothetical protein RJT34_14318 [Clitoria ternatea]|uniref:Smr domain-containing protein n=1 Tax=Clitoria ternatea TaxID=43366 RepID=A0AAN9JT36_CLITE
MSQSYDPPCSSPASAFHYRKSINISFPCFIHFLDIPSKTLLHVPRFSLQDAKHDNLLPKSSSFSKNSIWVNPKSPRPKHLLHISHQPNLRKLANSLDSCNPTPQHVSQILKPLGDNVSERDAVLILNSMVNPHTALLVLSYFQQKINPTRHVVLYNVTLKLFKKVKDVDCAENLFDEMLQRGVKPDRITFSNIIITACVCSLPHKAVEWFEKMPSFGCQIDKNMCSSMIFAYASLGNADMALELYDRAKAEKWHLGTSAFSALIKMFGMLGNYDGCLSVYDDMKALGAKPNMTLYNALLHAMGRAKMARKAEGIYNEMINNGFSPNWHAYTAVLKAYCSARYNRSALSVYREMKGKGMNVNIFLYDMLLEMCAEVGCVDEAVEIFEDIKSSGASTPSSWTFSSLIAMYCRSGKVLEAERMLNEMIQSGFQPNIFVLTSLVRCYGKAKRIDDAVKIFKQLLDLGITPNDHFCCCLVNVMTQTPKEELGKLIDCIEKANTRLGSVVSYLVEEQEGDLDFRKETSELLNSTDAEVKKPLCNCLIDLCVNLNMPQRARDLLDLGVKLEIYANIQSRSETQWSLHLKELSVGTAITALHVWINDLSKALESGEKLPPLLGINTGQGKHKYSDIGLARVFKSHLKELNAPFHEDPDQPGWFLVTKEAAMLFWCSTESIAKFDSLEFGLPTVTL